MSEELSYISPERKKQLLKQRKLEAAIATPLGFVIFFTGLGFRVFQTVHVFFILLLLGSGLLIYFWGCSSLAKVRGYNTALILTAFPGFIVPLKILDFVLPTLMSLFIASVIGFLIPLIILLALPNKYSNSYWYTRK